MFNIVLNRYIICELIFKTPIQIYLLKYNENLAAESITICFGSLYFIPAFSRLSLCHRDLAVQLLVVLDLGLVETHLLVDHLLTLTHFHLSVGILWS